MQIVSSVVVTIDCENITEIRKYNKINIYTSVMKL